MRAKILSALRFSALVLVALVAGMGGSHLHQASAPKLGAFGPGTPTFTPAITGPLTLQMPPLAVGTAYVVGDPGVVVDRTLTTVDGGSNAHGVEDYSTFERDDAGLAYASFNADPTMAGGNFDHFKSFQGYPTVNISGTLGYLANFDSLPTLTAGTTSVLEHFNSGDALGSGTITYQYGFRAGGMTRGTSGNWAFYADGTTSSYFGGKVGIGAGATAPSYQVDVRGNVGAGNYNLNAVDNTPGAANVYAPAAYSLALGTNSVQRVLISSTGVVSVNSVLALPNEVVAPSSPSTGFVLYVDSTTHALTAKSHGGTVTPLALP